MHALLLQNALLAARIRKSRFHNSTMTLLPHILVTPGLCKRGFATPAQASYFNR
jgi:hypothetical protein